MYSYKLLGAKCSGWIKCIFIPGIFGVYIGERGVALRRFCVSQRKRLIGGLFAYHSEEMYRLESPMFKSSSYVQRRGSGINKRERSVG